MNQNPKQNQKKPKTRNKTRNKTQNKTRNKTKKISIIRKKIRNKTKKTPKPETNLNQTLKPETKPKQTPKPERKPKTTPNQTLKPETKQKPKLELELEIEVNKKKLKKHRKDFDELRHKFSNKDEISGYRKAFYNAKKHKLSDSETEDTIKNLNRFHGDIDSFDFDYLDNYDKNYDFADDNNTEKLGVLEHCLKSLIVIITNQY